MEFLSENRFIRDEALTKEYCRYIWYRGPIAVFYYVATALFLLALLLSLFGDSFPWYYIAGIVFCPIMQLVGYRSQVKTLLQQGSLLNNGGCSIAHVGITQNGVVDISPDVARNVEFPFFKVKKVRQTQNLILLFLEGKLCLLLHKNGFNKGTYQHFLNFLAQKGIK